MPRIIYRCRYLKAGQQARVINLIEYTATRTGVEKITNPNGFLPSTEKQHALIERILKELPDTADTFEYEDYIKNPTKENASEFINEALENNLDLIATRKNFVDYIANRPSVERIGMHGLFTDDGQPVVLSTVQDEIANQPGNVWTNIVSLRREDAERLGYDNASAWRDLMREQKNALAESLKIEPGNLRWYAAYHDKGHHPHIHIIAYATGPKKAYLTKQGIEQMRSALAREIFRQDLLQIYERQTVSRNTLNRQSNDAMRQIILKMQSGVCENKRIEADILLLADRLRNTGGKKVYGYLKADVKAIIDRIVDELATDERVAGCYREWCALRGEVLKTYTDKLHDPVPLSQKKEFKPIKNMVIAEAMSIGNHLFAFEPDADPNSGEAPDFYVSPDSGALPDDGRLFCDDMLQDDFLPDFEVDGQECSAPRRPRGYNAEWNDRYKEARSFLYGNDDTRRDFDEARRLFLYEAECGNALAMHDLGRIYMDGLGLEIDTEAAQDWYKKTFAAFKAVESEKHRPYIQYRIGKLLYAGLGAPQDHAEAARWFRMAALKEHKYAQYSLAGLYCQGKGVQQDFNVAFSLYKKSAAQGNAYADFETAKMCRDGIGAPKNEEEADKRFKSAFDGFRLMEEKSKDDKLQYRLGWMLHTGTGSEKDTAAAVEYFEQAATLGNVNAQYALAKIYLDTDSGHENVVSALKWMNRAAANGNSLAQYAMAKLYLTGSHVEKNIDHAVELFTKAAKQENQFAQYALGKLHLSGDEVPKDVGAAAHWLHTAADQGNQFAQYALGKLYLSGEDAPKDVDAAVHWLCAAADQGNQFAQYAIGKLYLSGEDAPKDVDAAVHWLCAAADQGNQFAQYALGKLYLSGEDVPKDVDAAIHWLCASADQGNQFAQYVLGKMHLMGWDVPRDEILAGYWLSCSAAQGNIYAQFFLERIDSFRDPSAMLAATRLLQHIGNIFEDNRKALSADINRIDRKRQKKLREKKLAQGHAHDDHEQQIGGM